MDLFLSGQHRDSSRCSLREPPSRRPVGLCLAGAFLMALLQSLWPAEAAGESLAAGIPSESILFLHWRNAQDSGFASTYLGHLEQKVADSGFLDAFFRELTEAFPAASRKAYESHVERWSGLVSRIPWWPLVASEVAAGGRVGAQGNLEFILLFRRGPRHLAGDLLLLRELLYAFSASGEEYELEVGIRNGAATTILQNRLDESDQVAVSAQGNIIGISTSSSLLRRSFQLLSLETLSPGFSQTPGYAKLQDKLELPGGKRSFAGRETARFELVFQPRGVLRDEMILDVIDEYHYVARFSPDGVESRSRTVLSEGEGNPLRRAIGGQGDAAGLAAAIPAEVSSYSVTSGTDPAGIYDFCMELLVNITGKAESAESFEREQVRLGVRLQRDILRNLTGRRATVVFAPGGGAPGALPARAFLFETRAGEKAAKAVAGAVEALAGPLERWNLELGSRGRKGSERSLHVFKSGLLGFETAFGVYGDFLVLATSVDALGKVAGAIEGRTATLAAVADGSGLDWLPKSKLPVDSFYRGAGSGLWDSGDWLLKVAGLTGTLLPDAEEPSILKPLLMSLPRLEGALRSMDVFTEGSGYCFRNGNVFFSTASRKLQPVAGF